MTEYFPIIGARSRFTCAGTASGLVMSANFSAEPQSHERVRWKFRDGLGDGTLCRLRVLHQRLHDHIDGDRVVIRMPAVVIGDKRERDVADLGLARELRLLQVRHADHVHAPRSIQLRLCQRRELRALHADVGAAAMDVCANRRDGIGADLRELRTNRMRKRDVRRQAAAEKRADARPSCDRRTDRARRCRAADTPPSGFQRRWPK